MSSTPTPTIPTERIQPQLVMWRPSIDALDPVKLAPGYAIRHWRPDDGPAWENVILHTFGGTPNFETGMRADPAFRPERVLLVMRGDTAVATASAWHIPKYGMETGYLHMVATLPDHQGKGLGAAVSLTAMHHMRGEARRSAMLQTDDFRLPAVKAYLRLGFEPLLIHENQRDRWRNVLTHIGRAECIPQFKAQLEAPVRVFG
ncbi:MAG: GNAT family N-acetyltransferase [Planctomycetes bacterium]|nr:GNAT family N-acetyltransferase [Planctomycetota bacterium]